MKPNALVVTTQGTIDLVEINFSDYADLNRVINAKRVLTLHTRKIQDISTNLGIHLIAFCERNGEARWLQNNGMAALIVGLDNILGDVVFCRSDLYFTPMPFAEKELVVLKDYIASNFHPPGKA